MGGDGATYDIGFGALSRLLSTSTPIKVVVLNTGSYSNTGGQASTASLTGQDSDLSRFGAAHAGKQEERKELALIAAFHPNVFVVQSCAALQGHFLKHVVEFLNHNDSPAVLDVYTPCQGEQGIADPQASRHGRLAVESRMNPLFVHDPRRGADLHSRFSLDGNPDPGKDWTTSTIEYVEDGATKLMDAPLTPADFALTEGRFKKQFRPLAADAVGVPVHEYIDLEHGRPDGQDAVRVVDRRRQEADQDGSLADARPPGPGATARTGEPCNILPVSTSQKLDADHHVEVEALKRQVQGSGGGARILDRLDRARDVRTRRVVQAPSSGGRPPRRAVTTRLIAASHPEAAPAAKGDGSAPVSLADEDVPKCNNCKTCYQEIPELFEKTRIVVDGAAKEVGHLIPGALDHIKITPELKRRIERVAANCDAEIIHAH